MNKTNVRISLSLQKALILHPEHKVVYFDASGKHYFNTHLLKKNKDDKDKPELYGSGLYSHHQLIEGQLNVDGIKEEIAKGDPLSKIAFSMTREEVLDAEAYYEGDDISVKMANLSDAEKTVALGALGLSPKMLKALQAIAEQDED